MWLSLRGMAKIANGHVTPPERWPYPSMSRSASGSQSSANPGERARSCGGCSCSRRNSACSTTISDMPDFFLGWGAAFWDFIWSDSARLARRLPFRVRSEPGTARLLNGSSWSEFLMRRFLYSPFAIVFCIFLVVDLRAQEKKFDGKIRIDNNLVYGKGGDQEM